MNTQDAMLAALSANPDDLVARLVYCDWVQEFGTESDWQNYLDKHPDHHEVRLRFADWLDEHDDPRAAGYRALAICGRYPWQHGLNHCADWARTDKKTPLSHEALPFDWFDLLQARGKGRYYAPNYGLRDPHTDPASRQELEDAAARAFLLLPPGRQAELLTPAVPAASG